MVKEKTSLLFLGTGASTGIPVIGCKCAVCHSSNPKNKRLRTAAFLQIHGNNFLIDAGPDVRRQLLQYDIDRISALILTHTHFDHVGGLEELRIFNFIQKAAIDCLLSESAYKDVQKLFFYHFHNQYETLSAKYHFTILVDERGETLLNQQKLEYFTYKQGGANVLGLRFGKFAYVTDIKNYSPDIFQFLEGVETLVLSALRPLPSPMHLTIDEAVEFAQKVGAKKSYFTHIAHEVEHEEVDSTLPEGIHLAYDGLRIFIDE